MAHKELIEKEMALLIKWGELSNGYSKTFRVEWANKNIQERVVYLEMLVRDALMTKAIKEVRGA